MKTKILTSIAGALSLIIMLAPLGASASVDRAVMEGVTSGPGPGQLLACAHYMDGSTEVNIYCSTVNIGTSTTEQQLINTSAAAVTADATSLGYTLTNGIIWPFTTTDQVNAILASSSLPMYVNGVAKTGYYAVVASSTVAGGSGVERFYIDSNGDGTGTAPSEVYTSSLQAVVWNSSSVYISESISVDTNRKYVDVTMGRLNFTNAIVSLISVLTGVSIGAAPNGTVVNNFVLVKR